ncbi:alpha/beta hydrolase family protein [Planotetraspora sp. A-T 1434]|uniref:alpha/beta hydrolase family protein n=1 Tax=Planotetraspora sp. A-T 1434 TaxID=2979219 RepID=UPI0021C0B422|nr:alpha/beta hydrolase family protein [Planotetraspora sp. A-T 1434]MCT9930796.1 alpha/beta hydrolase family protein [Planotetraspora sp. A-T 1434]
MSESDRLRLSRTPLAALIATLVVLPVTHVARAAAVPAPTPAALGPFRAATHEALAQRYAVSRAGILAAEETASAHGDQWRATMLHAMADPTRRFLSFDGRDGGRAMEVFGDLATADRIAVVVPGADTNLDKYGILRGSSLRLSQALGQRSAVIAWLGYHTPSTVSAEALTTGRADAAVPHLRAFVRQLRAARPHARVTLLCHSYGGVVCARAASDMDVADIVLVSSAGTTFDNVAALRTKATVWAGRGSGDWIAYVPHARLRLPFATIGFGADPLSPRFGARLFEAGDGGHSDYLKAGSPSLRSIVAIVAGQAPAQVGRDA